MRHAATMIRTAITTIATASGEPPPNTLRSTKWMAALTQALPIIPMAGHLTRSAGLAGALGALAAAKAA